MAPLALTDSLGPQINERTGAFLAISDTYITALTGTMATQRLAIAAVSDVFLVTWFLQVTSSGGLGATVSPRVDFYGAWDVGAGKAMFQQGAPMAAVNTDATSTTIMAIRAAQSDIFISAQAPASGGAAPSYNLYIRLHRPT